MIYLLIPVALISGFYIYNAISLRRIFSSYAETYGIHVGKIVRLYRYAVIEARKDGIKLRPETYAVDKLSQMLNRLTGDDISGLR